jgi:hypothetical protein
MTILRRDLQSFLPGLFTPSMDTAGFKVQQLINPAEQRGS